jgi:hypothetical protein
MATAEYPRSFDHRSPEDNMDVSTATHPRSEPDAEVGFSLERQPPVLFIDEAAFCDWVADAAAGASVVYFRGFLAFDRSPSAGTIPEPERKRLTAVAKRALQSARDGLVHLVQHRHRPGDYSYSAVKMRRASGCINPGSGASR